MNLDSYYYFKGRLIGTNFLYLIRIYKNMSLIIKDFLYIKIKVVIK